jgi:hypothetical protein
MHNEALAAALDARRHSISAASSMHDANLQNALALAGAGLHVFPCAGVAGDAGKVPLVGWRGDSTIDTDKIRRWLQKWPGAVAGVDLGKSGLFVVDCDKVKSAEQLDGQEYFESVILGARADSFPFVTSRTPSGGVHYIFRQPDGEPLGNGRGGLPKKKDVAIDVRGAGGFIVAPGAVMQDGRTYVLDGDLADVPAVPAWLLAIMRAKEATEVPANAPVSLPVVSMPPSSERVAAYSRAGYDAEIEEVRLAPKGARNDTLNTSAFKIGTMVGAGWVSEAEAYSTLVGAVTGWADQKKTIDTLRRGLREGMASPRENLPDEIVVDHEADVAGVLAAHDAKAADTRLVEHADGRIVDGEKGAPVSAPVEDGASGFPLTLLGLSLMANKLVGPPQGLVGFPPGLVGDLASWIVSTSRRPQPVLAIGAALTIVGTAAGQRVLWPYGSRPAPLCAWARPYGGREGPSAESVRERALGRRA